MKDYELLDSLGGIDSRFIEKAEKKPARFRLQYVAAAAACLALVAGAFFAYPKLTEKPDPIAGTEGIETAEQTVTENTAVIPGVEETEPENSGIEINPTEENPDIGIPDIIQETPDSNGPVNAEILNWKPMISGFGASEPSENIVVNDGEVLLSAPLEEAMDYYGDDVNYRVMLQFFQGGSCIDPGATYATLERKRLEDKGYVVALETVTEEVDNGLYVTTKIKCYFTLHATYEQLENFVPAGDLGYFVSLYEENFDEFENPDTSSYNGGMNSGN